MSQEVIPTKDLKTGLVAEFFLWLYYHNNHLKTLVSKHNIMNKFTKYDMVFVGKPNKLINA
jgi:hypothetical protein